MKLHIVLWRGQSKSDDWCLNGAYEDEAIARAQFNFETLRRPEFQHVFVSAIVADVETPEEAEKRLGKF
jgi:hypothetical protein